MLWNDFSLTFKSNLPLIILLTLLRTRFYTLHLVFIVLSSYRVVALFTCIGLNDSHSKLKILVIKATENIFRVCVAWYKHERGLENSRQLCRPETKSRVCITVENSPNSSSVYMRVCKLRKKVFYCFYKITFPRKNAKLFVWHWLKEKFLPVAKSCPRSLARVISSCCAKRCFPNCGFFSLKMSA